MIEIKDLCKTYGRQPVLQQVTFTLKRGEVLGLFGPNGAGKSTLLSLLALIARPDSGQYFFDGADALAGVRAVRPRIGYVPQDIALFEELTVRDNLLCWSRLPRAAARHKAETLAQTLDLEALLGMKVRKLSGGMKRRVNLAVSLLNEPELLVLDEPLAGVDLAQSERILGVLASLAQQRITQIVSGHSYEQLKGLAHSALVLKNGCVSYLGPMEGARDHL